jgi:Bacterial Ig-like domain (group 2)
VVSSPSPGNHPDTGGIAVPIAVGRPVIINCANVNKDSVQAALRRYHGALADSVSGPHTLAGYWTYEYLDAKEWCYDSHPEDSWWGADGLYHVKDMSQLVNCFYVYRFQRTFHSVTDPDYNPSLDPGNGSPNNPLPGDDVPTKLGVTIEPGSLAVDSGGNANLTATLRWSDGYSQSGGTWVSGAPEVVSVGSSSGVVTAVDMGDASITATIDSVSATVSVYVRRCDGDNSRCWKKLRSSDRDSITAFIGIYKRAAFGTDTAMASRCGRYEAKALSMLAEGKIYLGDSTVATVKDPIHNGESVDGKIHIDEDYFQKGRQDVSVQHPHKKDVVSTAFHEAAHALGSPNHTTDPPFTGDTVFSHLSHDNPNGCVRPYAG